MVALGLLKVFFFIFSPSKRPFGEDSLFLGGFWKANPSRYPVLPKTLPFLSFFVSCCRWCFRDVFPSEGSTA